MEGGEQQEGQHAAILPRGRDVVVVGLGAAGAAAADALAARGLRVLALDRFAPPHPYGSSHGHTRIIREAYFEHPLYVPLVQRAYEGWDELERGAGRPLLHRTGVLSVGSPDGAMVSGVRASADRHRLAHETFDAEALRRRWPVLHPGPTDVGVFERRGGLLLPERCIEALLARARGRGAELCVGETVLGWRGDGAGVTVTTDRRRLRTGRLVLAAGPWTAELLGPSVAPAFTVERQATFWFAPRQDPAAFGPDRCPAVLWDPGEEVFYMVPDLGDGVKAAVHHGGEPASPGSVRPPDAEDERRVRALLARLAPAANGRRLAAGTCLYTNSGDGHFVIDRHPAHGQVIVVSACSGHGFKFAPAVGEMVADLVETGRSRADLAAFSLDPQARASAWRATSSR